MGKVEYISDEENDVQVDLSLFKPHPMQGKSRNSKRKKTFKSNWSANSYVKQNDHAVSDLKKKPWC